MVMMAMHPNYKECNNKTTTVTHLHHVILHTRPYPKVSCNVHTILPHSLGKHIPFGEHMTVTEDCDEVYPSIFIGNEHKDWEMLTSNHEGERFLETVQDGFLQPLVKEPTRNNAILHLLSTSNIKMKERVEIEEHLGASDHWSIRFDDFLSMRSEIMIFWLQISKTNFEGCDKNYLL
ncbi:uncharacterized protein LOC106467406 isoform X3 [Limulus polyphemus]|uniref:Uncharacterized protein LOC106467406 isoform X3 n=1 Tax=Limulus polyphemus TaxID=6850 RepID=A0ABM1T5Y9_LIMPO|nr:uncharacterized protein LOC106467406 isoform X3 [Limulus polyphemus]